MRPAPVPDHEQTILGPDTASLPNRESREVLRLPGILLTEPLYDYGAIS
jgi:hypothetical protein